jgi:hypothetical protein
MLPAATWRFQEPGHIGCRAVALPNFGETDRGNLACRPDFKLWHYLLGDFVVAPVPDALPSLIVRCGDAPACRGGGLFE